MEMFQRVGNTHVQHVETIPVENPFEKTDDRFLGNSYTPYSMNRLFSEFFWKCGEVCLEVCETISGGIWEVLGGKMKENYPEKNWKNPKIPINYYEFLCQIALNSLFNE